MEWLGHRFPPSEIERMGVELTRSLIQSGCEWMFTIFLQTRIRPGRNLARTLCDQMKRGKMGDKSWAVLWMRHLDVRCTEISHLALLQYTLNRRLQDLAVKEGRFIMDLYTVSDGWISATCVYPLREIRTDESFRFDGNKLHFKVWNGFPSKSLLRLREILRNAKRLFASFIDASWRPYAQIRTISLLCFLIVFCEIALCN